MAPAGIESVRTVPRRHPVVRQAHPVKAAAASGMPARAAAGATAGPAPGGPPQTRVHPVVTGAPAVAIARAHTAGACFFSTRTGPPHEKPPQSESGAQGVRCGPSTSYPAQGLTTR
jgi:hypothetical protein